MKSGLDKWYSNPCAGRWFRNGSPREANYFLGSLFVLGLEERSSTEGGALALLKAWEAAAWGGHFVSLAATYSVFLLLMAILGLVALPR